MLGVCERMKPSRVGFRCTRDSSHIARCPPTIIIEGQDERILVVCAPTTRCKLQDIGSGRFLYEVACPYVRWRRVGREDAALVDDDHTRDPRIGNVSRHLVVNF